MRRVLLTTIALLAVTATAAVAADLPRAMPARAPAYVPIGYNWTGFYLGINGGYAWGRSHWSSFAGNADPSGGMVGGTAGYNWQAAGSPWVFGLKATSTGPTSRQLRPATCPTGCQTKNNWLEPCAAVGYAWDRVMPYVTGGLRSATSSNQPVCRRHDTNVG
jgi:outer membrane immunogenic protein